MNSTCHFIVRAGLLAALWLIPERARPIDVSGLADFVAKNADLNDFTNETFKGFSNFHTTRVRVFLDARLSEHGFLFTQVLIDNYTVSLYGAYARFENLIGQYLNVQIGFLPTPVGTFAARTYSNSNPLIGSPLLYNHHSSFMPLTGEPVGDVDDLIAQRDSRSKRGLPVIYDACWNSGIELYGSRGRLSYSLGALAGSVSKPLQEQAKNTPQITSRLGYSINTALMVGVSGWYGPYLFESAYGDSITPGLELSKYANAGLGFDLYAARNYLEIYSEGYYSQWEYPTLPDLSAFAGYLEAKYKFRPGWYLAGRFDVFSPDKVVTSGGSSFRWDYEARRYEIGIGRHFERDVLLKLVSQMNRFPEADHLDYDLHALQISVAFR